jgi:hypothetical protein
MYSFICHLLIYMSICHVIYMTCYMSFICHVMSFFDGTADSCLQCLESRARTAGGKHFAQKNMFFSVTSSAYHVPPLTPPTHVGCGVRGQEPGAGGTGENMRSLCFFRLHSHPRIETGRRVVPFVCKTCDWPFFPSCHKI